MLGWSCGGVGKQRIPRFARNDNWIEGRDWFEAAPARFARWTDGAAVPTWALVVSYFFTYLANIFSGSMAMNVPWLRARTSFFSLRISAALMWMRPSTLTSLPSA